MSFIPNGFTGLFTLNLQVLSFLYVEVTYYNYAGNLNFA